MHLIRNSLHLASWNDRKSLAALKPIYQAATADAAATVADAAEAGNSRSCRRRSSGHFPSDEVAAKLLYLAKRLIEKNWKMPPVTCKHAANQCAILFGERFTNALH